MRPSVKVGLELLERSVDLLAEDDPAELIQDRLLFVAE
jgi:hypothetical protein